MVNKVAITSSTLRMVSFFIGKKRRAAIGN
jgi:hypothetical protein